jgi:hypothetical protein
MASSSIAETVMPTSNRMANPGRVDEVAVYVVQGVATMAGAVGLR